MSDDGKTYSDLMYLLPEVSRIEVTWATHDDGIPNAVAAFALFGHDGALLARVGSEYVWDQADKTVIRAVTPRLPLGDRLPTILKVLEWLDPWVLEEAEGVSVIDLPSPAHVPDAPPEEW